MPGLKTITKINRITFNDVIDGLELGSVIYPKYTTSEAIIAYVRARQNSIGSNVETLYHLFDNRAEAIEFRIGEDAPVIGVPIMNLKLKDSLLIACINRGGKIIFPRGQDTIEQDDGQYDTSRDVFWASGACMMVRADVFRKLGGGAEGKRR